MWIKKIIYNKMQNKQAVDLDSYFSPKAKSTPDSRRICKYQGITCRFYTFLLSETNWIICVGESLISNKLQLKRGFQFDIMKS